MRSPLTLAELFSDEVTLIRNRMPLTVVHGTATSGDLRSQREQRDAGPWLPPGRTKPSGAGHNLPAPNR